MEMQNSDWEALLDVVREMAETRTLEPLLTYATQQALGLAGAEQGYLVLLNDDGSYDYRVQFGQSGERIDDPAAQISTPVLHKVLNSGEPVISADTHIDGHQQFSSSIRGARVHPIMCLPLIARGTLIGALYMENRSANVVFDDTDLRRMQYFASQAAIAIENAMLNETLETRAAARTTSLKKATWQLHTLSRVVDQSPNAIMITDQSGTIEYVNRAMCALAGIEQEDVLDRPADIIERKLAEPEIVQEIRAAITQGDEWQGEIRNGHADGSTTWLDLQVSPIVAPDGTITHYVAVIEDITARKQAVAALRESEERLEFAITGGEHALWDWDLSSGLAVRNARWAEMLGYTPAEIGRETGAWRHLCHPDDRDRIEQAYIAHLAGETPFFDAEYRLRTKAGGWLWVHDRGRVVARNAEGKPLRMAGTQHDITRRKVAEYALQQAHDRLAVLQQVDFELTSELAVDYAVRIALNAAVQLSGADAGLIGMEKEDNTIEVVHAIGAYTDNIGATMPLHDGITARVMRDCAPVLVHDVADDPDYVAAVPNTESQMTLPLMSGERLIGVLSLETCDKSQFDDDTFSFVKLLASRIAVALDNAKAYEELAHLVGELDAFANTVAHDLKNPLSLITGYVSLLLDSQPDAIDDDLFRDSMSRIHNNAMKMADIIDALLLLAGVRKEQPVQLMPLDMQPIVTEVCERLHYLIADTGATITVPDDWPLAQGYLPWVEQVWINYISNALKYGGRPPQVTLGAEQTDTGVVRFWVQDNGPGLTPAQQAQVFTPFTRLSNRKVEGHGLGLSIAQRIVTKLGGTVEVTGAPDGGCIFSFTLPAVEAG